MTRRAVLFVLLCTAMLAPLSPGRQSGGLAILLSNDDGYAAPGLKALTEGLQGLGEITVAAPLGEQSAKSQSLATREPIMVNEFKQPNGVAVYAIDAPPASCVRLAVESLLPRKPDLVVSGINRGENLGTVVYISGTVGAAREAAMVNLPAIAVSVGGNDPKDYAAAASFTRALIEQMQGKKMIRPGLFLNVNVPAGERKGVRLAKLSMKYGDVKFDRRVNPSGRVYFWQMYRPITDDSDTTDVGAFYRGFITVTPMSLDVTADQSLKSMQSLGLRLP